MCTIHLAPNTSIPGWWYTTGPWSSEKNQVLHEMKEGVRDSQCLKRVCKVHVPHSYLWCWALHKSKHSDSVSDSHAEESLIKLGHILPLVLPGAFVEDLGAADAKLDSV